MLGSQIGYQYFTLPTAMERDSRHFEFTTKGLVLTIFFATTIACHLHPGPPLFSFRLWFTLCVISRSCSLSLLNAIKLIIVIFITCRSLTVPANDSPQNHEVTNLKENVIIDQLLSYLQSFH